MIPPNIATSIAFLFYMLGFGFVLWASCSGIAKIVKAHQK